MTAARARLESVVDALRRKQLLSITMTAFIEVVLAGALVYALLRLGLPNVHLSKPRRVILLVGLMLVFAAALLIEQARQGRSALYLAKRIDDANQLGDHFVSALSFEDPTTLGFEQACVNSLILRLQATQIRIPDVRLERLWLLVPAFLIAAGTGVVEYRRRQRPDDDGSLKIMLPGDLRNNVKAMEDVGARRGAQVDPALTKRMNDTRDMLEKLVDRSSSKETVLRDISMARDALRDYDSKNPSLIDAALQLGDPNTQRAQMLLNAVRSGDKNTLDAALRVISDALSGKSPPPLSEEERSELAGILDSLAQASHNSELGAQLTDAARSVRDGKTGPEAARPIDNIKGNFTETLSRDLARKQLENSIRSALAAADRQAELAGRKAQAAAGLPSPGERGDGGAFSLGAQGPRASSPDDEDPADPGDQDSAGGGSGAGSAASVQLHTGRPELPSTGRDTRVTSPWVGAPVRQLVAAGTANDASGTSARQFLADQKKQVESEVRREEIPAEYAQSIRRYFSFVQLALEQKWKPSK
jgi:hypothetical protein